MRWQRFETNHNPSASLVRAACVMYRAVFQRGTQGSPVMLRTISPSETQDSNPLREKNWNAYQGLMACSGRAETKATAPQQAARRSQEGPKVRTAPQQAGSQRVSRKDTERAPRAWQGRAWRATRRGVQRSQTQKLRGGSVYSIEH